MPRLVVVFMLLTDIRIWKTSGRGCDQCPTRVGSAERFLSSGLVNAEFYITQTAVLNEMMISLL
jgi:hypothetical protein